jgi:hypothetical protein
MSRTEAAVFGGTRRAGAPRWARDSSAVTLDIHTHRFEDARHARDIRTRTIPHPCEQGRRRRRAMGHYEDVSGARRFHRLRYRAPASGGLTPAPRSAGRRP